MQESMEGRRDPKDIKIPPLPEGFRKKKPSQEEQAIELPDLQIEVINDFDRSEKGFAVGTEPNLNVEKYTKELPSFNYTYPPKKQQFQESDKWQNMHAALAEFEDEDNQEKNKFPAIPPVPQGQRERIAAKTRQDKEVAPVEVLNNKSPGRKSAAERRQDQLAALDQQRSVTEEKQKATHRIELASKLAAKRHQLNAKKDQLASIRKAISGIPKTELTSHPRSFVQDSGGEKEAAVSGFIDNKEQPKNLATDLDEERWEAARPKFSEAVADIDDLEIINPKPLFTVGGFLANHEQNKEAQRLAALEDTVAKKIQLETEMKKAELNYIWAYKKVYPKFAKEPEDDISKFPPPKFTFLSKDKQNLVDLYQAVLDSREEWMHAQGEGFVSKNVKKSGVKFHSESLGEPGNEIVDAKKLEKAQAKDRLALEKEEKRNEDTDSLLKIQEVLSPEFLFLKEKPNLRAVKAKADLAKSVYAKAYREMFPEQFKKDQKVTDDFVSFLQPPKVGVLSFNKDKKRMLNMLYEVVQQAISLENQFSK